MKKIIVTILALTIFMTMTMSGFPLVSASVESSDFSVIEMTTEYEKEPLGIDVESPRFGWKIDSNVIGTCQTAYQIIVKDANGNEVWDSNIVSESTSVAVKYAGDPLEAGITYIWEVTVWNENNEAKTGTSTFATGVKDDWSGAQWISHANAATSVNTTMFRTEGELTGEVIDAKLFMTSLGTYTVYIDGREVRYNEEYDDVLNPGWTDFNQYINYQTYDVTDYFDGDSFALAATVGHGWYSGGVGRYTGAAKPTVGNSTLFEICLLGKLVVTYDDGTQDIFVTNTNDWKATDNTPYSSALATAFAAYMSDDIYHGEKYDATKLAATEGWMETGFDDTGWSAVTSYIYPYSVISSNGAGYAYIDESLDQHPQSGYKFKAAENNKPVDQGGTSQLPKGEVVSTPVDISGDIVLQPDETLILDLEQNMVGVVNITVSGDEETVVQLRHAEMLNDGRTNPNASGGGSDGPKGTLYQAHLKAGGGECEALDRYKLDDSGIQSYQPSFTYHGFRYVEVTANKPVTVHKVVGKVMTSAVNRAGYLETSNTDVNQLISNTIWSQRGNYFFLPTDCPQRAERCGWTGDAQLFSETGSFNFDTISFLEHYDTMLNINQGRNKSFGAIVPGIANNYATAKNSGWSDAGIIIPWTLYKNTGDISFIEKSYSYMADYIRQIGPINGVTNTYATGNYGDWLALAGASTPYLNAIYRIYTVQLMEEMANLIGETEDAAVYNNLRSLLVTDFLSKYVDSNNNILSRGTGTTVDNAQTALLWALKLELYKDEAQRDAFIEKLAWSIRNENKQARPTMEEDTLAVGFLGVNVLLPILTESGKSDMAYNLLLQDKMPSWLYEVKAGATTIWERWNSYSTEDSFLTANMNSFNHFSYGACVEWMYENMSGIDADYTNLGFKNFILQPTPDMSGRITYVDGSFNSVYGNIVSNWKLDGSDFTYNCKVPANTTATLYLPTIGTSTVMANGVPVNEAEGVEVVGMTTHNGLSVLEVKLLSGSYEFASATGTTLKLANPSITEYEANQPFDVIVTTLATATKVKIVNEAGATIGKLGEVVTKNADGTKSYRITLMIGTPGELRTISAMVMGQIGDYQYVGASLDVKIVPATPVQNTEDIVSASAPSTSVVNTPFTVTVVTDKKITKVKIVGETGSTIGTLSSSVVTNGDTKTWTISIKVGSKGNRTITALGAGATGGYGEKGKSFDIKIT